MTGSRTYKIALQRQLTRRRRLHEKRWRELCQRRARLGAEDDNGMLSQKSLGAWWSTSEVADKVAVPRHVLRFWESRFPEVRTVKRGDGRRYYGRKEVELLRSIRKLLYCDGYTIKGVQKVLRGRLSRGISVRLCSG